MTFPLQQDVNKDMENVVEQPTIDHNYEDVDNKIYNYIDVDVAAYPLRNAMHEPGPPQQTEHGGALHHPTQLGSPVGFARQELAPLTCKVLQGGNNMAGLDRNVGYVPGVLRKDEKDDSISAANICGRLKSYKCHRPSLLRVIAITVAVVALLGAGFCVFMFLSSMENKNADPPIKESPNKRMLKSSMVSPALSKMTPAQAELATALPDNTTELPQMADTQPDQSTLLPGVISTHKTGISTNLLQKETALQTTERDLALARPPLVHGDSFGNIHVLRCEKGYRLLVGTCIKLVVSTGLFGFIKAGKFYHHAKMDCWMEGATLAMPKTEALDAVLRDLVKTEGGNKEHWIGMEEKDGTWYWVDGSKVGNNGYTGWNPGEPTYYQSPPRCGQYWSGRTGYPMWDDEGCSRRMRWFICQRPPS
ncbi:hypothetical protein Bbelb_055380 [Branchiostoma belcheri]|nr:hypothetical protein Bbelb_055380 [Branchiostoma belcheri]